mmetsp:Transcript_36688/g.105491  ORF Transcript_36688/g.105491 Transcript_36688/m.105491 type:complete len:273 (-) Transcript_36688:123-941(-)
MRLRYFRSSASAARSASAPCSSRPRRPLPTPRAAVRRRPCSGSGSPWEAMLCALRIGCHSSSHFCSSPAAVERTPSFCWTTRAMGTTRGSHAQAWPCALLKRVFALHWRCSGPEGVLRRHWASWVTAWDVLLFFSLLLAFLPSAHVGSGVLGLQGVLCSPHRLRPSRTWASRSLVGSAVLALSSRLWRAPPGTLGIMSSAYGHSRSRRRSLGRCLHLCTSSTAPVMRSFQFTWAEHCIFSARSFALGRAPSQSGLGQGTTMCWMRPSQSLPA